MNDPLLNPYSSQSATHSSNAADIAPVSTNAPIYSNLISNLNTSNVTTPAAHPLLSANVANQHNSPVKPPINVYKPIAATQLNINTANTPLNTALFVNSPSSQIKSFSNNIIASPLSSNNSNSPLHQSAQQASHQPFYNAAAVHSPLTTNSIASASSSGFTPTAVISPPIAAPAAVNNSNVGGFPIAGLPVDISVTAVGNGSDREWLDIHTNQPATSSPNQATIINLTGGMLIGLYNREDIHSALLHNLPNTHNLRIISYKSAYQFPKSKSKRSSYEGYDPAGIIKAHWLLKYRYLIPSVVVYVYEW
jgi:hypothetical protein